MALSKTNIEYKIIKCHTYHTIMKLFTLSYDSAVQIFVMKHHFSCFIDQKCWSIERLRSKLSHRSKCPNQDIFSVAGNFTDFKMIKVRDTQHLGAGSCLGTRIHTAFSRKLD